MHAGRHRHAHLEARIGRVHVQLVFGLADDFAVPRQRSRRALGFATDGKTFQQLSVEAQLELLWAAHADDVVVDLTPQTNPEGVLAVAREVVTHRQPAPRSEGQVFMHARVLFQESWHPVHLRGRRRFRRAIAHRHPADVPRRGEIAFEMRRRQRKACGHVVEPVFRFIRQQQRGGIDLQREQVANRVGVFGTIQTVSADASRLRIEIGGRVQRGLQPRGNRIGISHAWPRPVGRRHLARADLVENFLPGLRLPCQRRERVRTQAEATGQRAIVMTRDTVRFDVRDDLLRRRDARD